MSRSPRARDLELARVVASDPDVSAVRAALRELTRRAAEPRRKYDDDDDDDDDARADAEVEEIVRLVTYGTASHATAETRRACVEFAGTMLETTRNAAARRDESNQKRGEATKTEEEKDEQKMEEERRRARAERRRRRTRELFLEVLSARSREERDETTRRKIVDALMRATPVGTSSAREMMRALATVESFSRDDDAEAVVKALDAWTAMSDARIVALEGETDESTELARAVERVYWSVRSNCLAHRRREVRRAAVEACGALVTRVVLSRGDSRAHDAFGTSMLRLSVDEKSDVRRAVAFAVSRVFIARVNAGKFTIRDADADLLCAMFACDEETEEYAAERLREINAAHARKTMGEGCRSVAMFAVKEMLRCLKTHEVWDSDDARVRRARARAVARACEHLGDAVAPRVRDVLDILATMMNDDRNDALDVAHSALTYAPSIRRAWIRCVLDRVEEREDNGAALLEAVALSSYVLTWAASHELELDAKDIIDLLEVALRPEIAAAACRVVAVVDSCHKLLDVGAVVFADDQDVTQVRRDITAHSCTLTIIHASIYDVYEDDEIASQARRLSRMSTDGADEWRLIFNRLTTLFDDNSTSRAPSPRIGVDGACMTPEGVFAVFFECIRDGTLMKEVFDLVRRNVDASDKPPTARESEQSLLAAKSYIRVFDAYLCRTHVLDRLARRDVDGFDADFFPVFDALASRLRWNPRDAQFALGTLASTCFAHFCDEKQRCVLARWLASDGRADRVAEVIENFDCFACEERATAFAALHRALCEANPERARARLHAVARRALEVLNTGMKSERLLAVTCLSNALDALGDDASAGDYIARVFEFAADGDPDIRRATHDVLERARRHHSIRIRSLVVDSSDAKHADGLVGLKDAETPL